MIRKIVSPGYAKKWRVGGVFPEVVTFVGGLSRGRRGLQGRAAVSADGRAGDAGDKGELDQVFVVKGGLGGHALSSEEVPEIGGEDEQRVLRETLGVEMIEDLADAVVHEADYAVIKKIRNLPDGG